MESEVSAGIVTVSKSSGSKSSGDREYLVLRHENGGHWSFPKGHLENEETASRAAVRELSEETGLTVDRFIDDFRQKINYHYEREGKRVAKSVIYFLAFVPRNVDVTLSPEHLDFKWLPYPEARERLTYDNDRRLLDLAEETFQEESSDYE